MAEKRGSIGFFATYRPPVPLDIYSSPFPLRSGLNEVHMTDGKSYNYNGQVIPPAALKAILRRPMLAGEAKPSDVDSGRVSGLVFVSERTESLETLHIALRFNPNPTHVKVFNFADVYGTFNGARLEDNGCFAGDYLVYVTTKDDPRRPREPWNAVYRTNLITGDTQRLTPPGEADFSPSVSPSGRRIAVASLEFKEEGWDGEIEDLKTDIVVMDVDNPSNRKVVINNGGWPTWGSDNVLFFHRRNEKKIDDKIIFNWGVFRADITNGNLQSNTPQVTPKDIDSMTPAAIDATTVAVATIRDRLMIDKPRTKVDHYRHIEVFDSMQPQKVIHITKETNPFADHYNPFVVMDNNGSKLRIGYHRCNREQLKSGEVSRDFDKVKSSNRDIGLFRVSGVFPTFSRDGKKLAFVDNEFKHVWLADEKGLRPIHTTEGPDSVFSPVWNQDPEKDILYVCMGPSFHAKDPVNICAIFDASSATEQFQQLTRSYNNAFPSTNPEGTRLVFRSTRAGPEEGYKNLYTMDALLGEFGGPRNKPKRLTEGPWTDTHCQWSPTGDWIVFSSSRDRPKDVVKKDDAPDPGYFGVYLINSNKPDTCVRVLGSGNDIDDIPGHVNHPFFSPDGRTIVMSSDLAGVSVDPISLPLFLHSVRSYGDIFSVDIDMDDIHKNENLNKMVNRVTHSRYENSTPSWTMFDTNNPVAAWNLILNKVHPNAPRCPFGNPSEAESWHLTGHLCIPRRCC